MILLTVIILPREVFPQPEVIRVYCVPGAPKPSPTPDCLHSPQRNIPEILNRFQHHCKTSTVVTSFIELSF